MNPTLTMVASGLKFPEGPIAMPDGTFLVCDMGRRSVSRIGSGGKVSRVALVDGAPNGIAIGPDGGCYVANNGGTVTIDQPDGTTQIAPVSKPPDYQGGFIDRVDLASGTVRRLYDRTDQSLLSAPNDLVFDRSGGFWFTDTGKGGERDSVRGKLCYALPDGSSCIEMAFPMLMPNGVGLAPDETRLYVAETATARIWAFDLDAPGRIRRSDFPSAHGGTMLFQSPTYCLFDSLAVDAAGNICVGALIDGSIMVISPQGQLIERIPVPDRFPTNLCFGGHNLQTAYVTLGNSGKLVSLAWPRPGLPLNFLNV